MKTKIEMIAQMDMWIKTAPPGKAAAWANIRGFLVNFQESAFYRPPPRGSSAGVPSLAALGYRYQEANMIAAKEWRQLMGAPAFDTVSRKG